MNIDFVEATSAIAQKYISLNSVHPTSKYDYKKRGSFSLPVIEHKLHAKKCAQGESWTYYVIPIDVTPKNANENQRLYVGAQTQDRMFRGDGLGGKNYHHAEMRAGNGEKNLVSYLIQNGPVAIYRVNALKAKHLIENSSELSELKPLLEQPMTSKKHMGWWFEQYILLSQPNIWQWNSDPCGREIHRVYEAVM